MFVYRLSEPVDEFDGLTPLPEWMGSSAECASWAVQAVLALADVGSQVCWEGDMRHLPSAGVVLTAGGTSPYLVVKQDNNGETFVVTDIRAAWLTELATADPVPVEARRVGAWTHPSREDVADSVAAARMLVRGHAGEPAF